MDTQKKNENLLHIGSSLICEELSCPALANILSNSFKPTGGIWTSNIYKELINSCLWLDYLSLSNSLMYQKFSPYASIIYLKNNAKIYKPKSLQELRSMQKEYPIKSNLVDNHLIDYHKFAQDYDGIQIPSRLIWDNKELKDWCISSTVILNNSCIEKYKPIYISADIEYEENRFSIDKTCEERKILPISDTYVILFNEFNKLFFEYLFTQLKNTIFTNYKEFHEQLYLIYNRFNREHEDLIKTIINYLNSQIITDNNKITSDKMKFPLFMQFIKQNYDEINNMYEKNLIKTRC